MARVALLHVVLLHNINQRIDKFAENKNFVTSSHHHRCLHQKHSNLNGIPLFANTDLKKTT